MTDAPHGEGVFPLSLMRRAGEVLERARERGLRVGCAESCTGGLVAACLSAVPGASDVLACGFVVYENAAKMRLLGVSQEVLEARGAVSRECALAMAEGARERGRVDVAVAVTGIAGPGGALEGKPVGLVHFACAFGGGSLHREMRFGDIGRAAVRMASVGEALSLLEEGVILSAVRMGGNSKTLEEGES